MKTQTIFILIAVFIVIGGATFLTLNKKTETERRDNRDSQTNTYKNSYGTDNSRRGGDKVSDDNSTTQNPAIQKPTTQPTATTNEATPALYTLDQVATHNSQTDCWTVVNGKVYNITSYITRHPGGVRAISSICGKDGTSTFEGQHGGQSRPENTLSSFLIGSLK